MDIHAGETSPKAGYFDCNKCRHTVYLNAGESVVPCSRCGKTDFGERLLNVSLEWQKEDMRKH
jgi:hypothetical protein